MGPRKDGMTSIIVLSKSTVNRTNIPTDEDIAAFVTHCKEFGERLDNATIEDKSKYFDWLDVRGKLAIEIDEKVVYAKCRIGERRLSLVQTSP